MDVERRAPLREQRHGDILYGARGEQLPHVHGGEARGAHHGGHLLPRGPVVPGEGHLLARLHLAAVLERVGGQHVEALDHPGVRQQRGQLLGLRGVGGAAHGVPAVKNVHPKVRNRNHKSAYYLISHLRH